MAKIDKNINKIKKRNRILITGIISIIVIVSIVLGVTFKIKSDKEQAKAESESMNLLAKKEAEDNEIKVSKDNNKVNGNEIKDNTYNLDSKYKEKKDYNNYESYKNLENNKQAKYNKEVNNDEDHNVNKVEENLKVEKIYVSSTLQDQTGANYDPSNLIDGRSNTIWAEGAEGPGIEQFIRIDFNKNKVVKKLYIINGSAKSKRLYYANNRVRILRLDFGDGEIKDFKLQDDVMGEQEINLGKGIETPYVGMTIYDVYQGNKYNDTCISEIRAVGYDLD
ncbi:hypothetical protein K5V21_00600 [Clostridium sardiniense]|uniref:NAD glycohydrolase translocation F5/8 type C domain-containing protein n=1 Tax=Clostridium sardiniense TaxID=29369 RepID=A0ABS7KTG1_CLOSR|nr:discoidin domain-containing protein [Clostridium sardiniense]MBY0753942.1 hypothetical protein [Clostridium sardiniense]MDQ0459543.1 archaellin [Clostridium sardiniense]